MDRFARRYTIASIVWAVLVQTGWVFLFSPTG
jgi:hypothetical protein